ncbi:MAG: hypothetical protein O3C33_11275, partial [Actinomycetota bacterium]|nr:hypothetical protein [Actinomycetota bacterium]
MPALSVNAALGNAGLLVMLVASTVGAFATAMAIVGGNRRAIRQGPTFAWVILAGAVLAVV